MRTYVLTCQLAIREVLGAGPRRQSCIRTCSATPCVCISAGPPTCSTTHAHRKNRSRFHLKHRPGRGGRDSQGEKRAGSSALVLVTLVTAGHGCEAAHGWQKVATTPIVADRDPRTGARRNSFLLRRGGVGFGTVDADCAGGWGPWTQGGQCRGKREKMTE